MKTKKSSEFLLYLLTRGAALLTLGVLLYIIGFILVRGLPHLRPSLFALTYSSDNVSLLPSLIATLGMAALSLAVALPLGIGAAIWLVEYAGRGARSVMLVRLAAETLAGIPSIIYGLFGMIFFVIFLQLGYSLLAGALTLTIMILPLLLRAAEEAFLAVPDAWREGALALGAGRLRMVFRIVLPAAGPGLFAGGVLALGRITGETAALLYTAGTVAQIPTDLLQSARTLSVHMYALSSEGLHVGESYATAAILLCLVLLLNIASAAIARKIKGSEQV
jgi:phosphate transport system permease protein